ncbi:MAG TPA: hypothetical protein VG892_07770 [Terriglobales bacterium]|nr:hypothetical protein [Terriglobales bacterium]
MFKWQMGVAMSIYFWVAALMVGDAIQFGWTPWFAGFAPISLAQANAQSIRDLGTKLLNGQQQAESKQIEQQIIDAQSRACNAEKEKNFEAVGFANDKIRTLKDQFYDLNKRGYDVPTCHQLGIE